MTTPLTLVETEEQDMIDKLPYDQAKFYTPMRWRLWELTKTKKIPASVVALMVGLHMVCDWDAGEFTSKDVTEVRRKMLLPKQTVSHAFRRALQVGLICELAKDTYVIAHYEEDRLGPHGYFRLNENLIRQLSEMVAHHNPRIILFALELMDRGRVFDAEICYSMKTLMRTWRLGSCPSRVSRSLQLLSGISLYTVMPNSREDGENLHFYLVKNETYTDEQKTYRALNGKVASATKSSFQFASRGRGRFPWKEVARTTRIIIRYALDHHLSEDETLQIAGLFGATCATNNVQRRVPYLRKAIRGLHRDSQRLAS